MKKVALSAMTIGCLSASSLLYGANLNIPMAFEFIALDGQKVERSLVSHKDDLELAPGVHEIAIRYSDVVVTDVSDTPETVKSAPFIITLTVSGDEEYELNPAGGDIIRDPLRFAEAPEIVITRKDGEEVTYSFTQTDISQRDFDTKLYGKSLAPAAAVPVAQAQPKSTIPAGGPAEEIYELEVSAAPEVTAVEGGQGASPEQMLRLWWERADEETRKEFLGWAIKQL